jgi:hypothetical protein
MKTNFIFKNQVWVEEESDNYVSILENESFT